MTDDAVGVAGSPTPLISQLSLAAVSTAVRDHLTQQCARQLRESSTNDAERVLKSASGTAKYAMHQRYLAHALGFGPDSVACMLLPIFWRSEWPEAMERVYTSLLLLEYKKYQRLEAEERSVWSRIFAERVANEVPEGSLGIGCGHART